MADVSIEIEGLDRLLSKIKNIRQLQGVTAAMRAAALHVKGKIAVYPPESEANAPGSGPWYQRGYGTRYPSGGGRKTSETLGRKWTIEKRDGGLTQIVGNNVSYGPFVQDEDRQAWFHRARGWKTTEKVAEDESTTVIKFVRAVIDRILQGA